MFDEVKKILIDEMDIEEAKITPSALLTSDLGINSLELADLVLICEDKYGISVSDDDIRSFLTVSDVVTYLEAASN